MYARIRVLPVSIVGISPTVVQLYPLKSDDGQSVGTNKSALDFQNSLNGGDI